jgi:hypothetical protein
MDLAARQIRAPHRVKEALLPIRRQSIPPPEKPAVAEQR